MPYVGKLYDKKNEPTYFTSIKMDFRLFLVSKWVMFLNNSREFFDHVEKVIYYIFQLYESYSESNG